MNAIVAAFLYFYHSDRANAAIHMASVKYSPITFALRDEVWEIHNNHNDVGIDAWQAMRDVAADKGAYELDKGR